MGIDFNGLIKNLGTTAAKLQNNKEKIDTKTELNTYVSGWDAIKAKAVAENAQAATEDATNIQELEGQMKSELASLMGAEFGQTAGVQNKGTAEEPVFSDEDISLENMMSLLEPEDGLNIQKLREYNSKPLEGGFAAGEVTTMADFGFDLDLVEILMDTAPKAVRYIADAIKNGSADRITDIVHQQEYDVDGAKNVLGAMTEQKNQEDINYRKNRLNP